MSYRYADYQLILFITRYGNLKKKNVVYYESRLICAILLKQLNTTRHYRAYKDILYYYDYLFS